MKRLLAVLLAVLLTLGVLPMAMAEEAAAGPVKRVILDSDMNYLGDDGQSLLMLAQADKLGMVDFLGVTLSGGNSWLAEEACAALRQLEMLGREDIPVYAGCEVPIMGFRDQHAESVLFGYPEYAGIYYDRNTEEFLDPAGRPDVSEYLALEPEPSYGYPETARLQEGHAVDFIIEQVHKYPGEVTILVMGSSTNIALAVRQDPTIVDDCAGIMYSGGCIDIPAHSSTADEFNMWFDPEATKITLNTPWAEQVIMPNDCAFEITKTVDVYDRVAAKQDESIPAKMLAEHEYNSFYSNDGTSKDAADIWGYVWDIIVCAYYLNPDLGVRIEERYVDMDTNFGISYGHLVSWPDVSTRDTATGKGMPYGVQKVKVLFEMDEEAFWDFYVELMTA